jgi:hypothetical protein
VGQLDFELVAASLRADASDMRAFVEALAEKLAGAIPDRTTVERTGLFGGKRVRGLAVRLGDAEYRLEHDPPAVACHRRTLVRGIALKTEELPLDDWIERLSRDLTEEASSSEHGRAALARLLGTT